MVSSEENVILRSIEVISMAVHKEVNQQAINELKNDLELFLGHEKNEIQKLDGDILNLLLKLSNDYIVGLTKYRNRG